MERILILDDDKNQLKYLENLLGNYFECVTFCNPIEAMKSFRENNYLGVITDLHMPLMNGIEFIKKISLCSEDQFPIVVFSGDLGNQSRIECLELGVRDYLHCGMDEKEIILRVKNNFHKKNKLSYENIVIDEKLMHVYFEESLIDVTQIEYKILTFLLRHHGQVSKKKLLNFVWPSRFVLDKTLNTHMTNLRAKMKEFNYTLLTTKEDIVVIAHLNLKETMVS